MARLTWSEQAVSDLQNIYRFIARDSLAAARLTVERIRDSALRLTRSPEMGRPLPEGSAWKGPRINVEGRNMHIPVRDDFEDPSGDGAPGAE